MSSFPPSHPNGAPDLAGAGQPGVTPGFPSLSQPQMPLSTPESAPQPGDSRGGSPPPPVMPLAWQTAPPPKPRRRVLPVVLGGVAAVMALVLIAAIALQLLRRDNPGPSAPSSPTSAGSPFPKYNGNTPEDNVLYNIGWDHDAAQVACPKLGTIRTGQGDAITKTSLTAIVQCLTNLNAPPLAEYEIDLPEPKIVFFKDAIVTGCEEVTDDSFGAMCSTDGTLYFSLNAAKSTDQGYASEALGLYWIASHEFGHWVQYQTGIISGTGNTNLDSRRIELQANCIAGMFLNAVWTMADGNDSLLEAMYSSIDRIYGDQVPGEGTHGSPASIKTWFAKGFADGGRSSYAGCNTFVAAASEVS